MLAARDKGAVHRVGAAHEGGAEPRDQLHLLPVGLVDAPPADVRRQSHARREAPVHADRRGLQRRDAADLPEQRLVPRAAQREVVRQESGVDHLAEAVHGIHAHEDGDAVALQRL